MAKPDLTQAVEIGDGIYWVGFDDPKAGFRCNPYLMNDGDESVIFDPGSVPHFPVVVEKVKRIASLEKLSHIIVHHQDPDMCGAIPQWEKILENLGTKVDICTTDRAAVLIAYYGIKSEFYRIDSNGWKLTLQSGRTLKFIFTPFLHFPGAFMTYDEKSKILFSSDIFGGFSYDWDLYANEYYPEAMKAFHENYMPSNEILRNAMNKLDDLDIEIIAPQHGSIIKKEKVREYIDLLKNLECGSDFF